MSVVENICGPHDKIDEVSADKLSERGVGTDKALINSHQKVNTSLKQRSQRKKRKATTVLAVGASREINSIGADPIVNAEVVEKSPLLTSTAPETGGAIGQQPLDEVDETDQFAKAFPNHHMPLELVPPIIPENTTGKPNLSSFCSSYPRPKKQRRGGRAAAPTEDSEAHVPGGNIGGQLVVAADVARHAPVQQHAGPVVQIVNGEIVLQESSIVFHGSGADANAHLDANEGETMTVVEEEAEMAVVGATYTSFATGRRARPKVSHWTVEETQLFYEALRQVGLDFGTMEAYFESSENPNIRKRLRRQLKRKYQAECSKNPALIEKTLQPRGRVSIDLSVFQLTEDAIREMETERENRKNSTVTTSAVAIPVLNDADSLERTSAKLSDDTNSSLLWPESAVGEDPGVENEETEDVFGSDPIFFDDTGVPAVNTMAEEDGGKERVAKLVVEHSASKKRKQSKFRSTTHKKASTRK
jgi:Myb DNA-binding like